jgi:hypothetical protein
MATPSSTVSGGNKITRFENGFPCHSLPEPRFTKKSPPHLQKFSNFLSVPPRETH